MRGSVDTWLALRKRLLAFGGMSTKTKKATNQVWKQSKANAEFGIEALRHATRVFDACNETFNQRFDCEQLMKLYYAHMASDWDILPDAWTAEQINEAIHFRKVPNWGDHENDPLPSEASFSLAVRSLDD